MMLAKTPSRLFSTCQVIFSLFFYEDQLNVQAKHLHLSRLVVVSFLILIMDMIPYSTKITNAQGPA